MSSVKEGTVTKILLSLCYATYAMAGLILGMRTNIFHFIQRDYLDGFSHIATLVLVSGIFMQISLYMAGHLIGRFGYRKLLTVGIIISAIPLALMYLVRSIVLFDVNYALFMAGYGIVVLTLNLYASSLMPARRGNTLLMLHLFFSLGALAGPRWISFLTDRGIPWQSVLSFSTVPFFIIAFLFSRVGSHISVAEAKQQKDEKPQKNGGPACYIKEVYVWLFIVIFLCSQIWEYGIGTWFVIFANKTKGLSSSEAALYLTFFYASYPLIRIVFSRIIHNLNLLMVILGAFFYCLLSGGIGLVSGNFLFYSMTGAGVALFFPAIMAAMQHIFGENATKKIGFITMAGGLVQYAAIWGVGLMSDKWGIGVGFPFMLVYLIFGALAVTGIMIMEGRKKSGTLSNMGPVRLE